MSSKSGQVWLITVITCPWVLKKPIQDSPFISDQIFAKFVVTRTEIKYQMFPKFGQMVLVILELLALERQKKKKKKKRNIPYIVL